MKTVKLGDVPEGELFIWNHRTLGEVYGVVLRQGDLRFTFVMADNNIEYSWTKDLDVQIDSPE